MTPVVVTFDDVAVGDRVRSPGWPYTVYMIVEKRAGKVIVEWKKVDLNNLRWSLTPEDFDARKYERVVLG